MENVVAMSKAPVLKLTMVKGSRKKIGKVLRSTFVERLVVEGPCTMNLVPVMENLKVVEVKLDSLPHNSCTYWRSKQNDRNLHRNGLCCVNIGKMFQKCPKLEKFMGLEVGSVNKATFNVWSLELARKFHEDYLKLGGSKEFKSWRKTRWFFEKQVILPTCSCCAKESADFD